MASPSEIEQQLSNLTERQCKILYWLCQGKQRAWIAKKTANSEATVKNEIKKIYENFNLDYLEGRELEAALFGEICPIYRRAISDEEDCMKRSNVPPKKGLGKYIGEEGTVQGSSSEEISKSDFQDTEEPMSSSNPPQKEPREQTQPPSGIVRAPARSSRLPWLLVAVLLILLAIAAFLILNPRQPDQAAQAPAATNVPTATAFFPTSAPTRIVTNPPGPTHTTVAQADLFSDDFVNGPRAEWNVTGGQPITVDGRVTAAVNELTMQVGENLTQYTVEFDYDPVGNSLCCDTRHIYLLVANKLKYGFSGYDSFWQELQQDKWVGIDPAGGLPTSGHFMLKVDPPRYTVFVDKKKIREIIYGTPLSGPIAISLQKGTYIDNFSLNSP